MKRKLSSLTQEELAHIETAAADPGMIASGATEGLLVDVWLSGDGTLLSAAQGKALAAFLVQFRTEQKAARIFAEIMEPGIYFGRAKRTERSR